MHRIEWSAEAEAGLARTLHSTSDFDALAFLRTNVLSGAFELWRVEDHSFMVTHSTRNKNTQRGILFVWGYEGRNLNAFADVLVDLARRNNLDTIQFETFHRSMIRMLRRFDPREIGNHIYSIEVAR